MDNALPPLEWHNEKRKVNELKAFDKNPRKLTEEQKKHLTASLQKFNLVEIPAVDSDGTLIAGHQRVTILKALGRSGEEIDVRMPNRKLTEDEFKEYNLRSNKNTGEWENNLLKEFGIDMLKDVGFGSDELDKLFPVESTENDDAVPEVAENEFGVKRGDIWQLGRHRLMCGDSTNAGDVALLMDGKKADMVFTDPPYGVSYADKNKYLNAISRGNRIQTEIENDHKSVDDLGDSVIFPAFQNIKSILADKSSYYITAPQGGDLLMMMMMMMMKAGLTLRHMLIWVKNNHVLGRTDYNYKHEPILFGWVDRHEFYGNGEHQFSTWEIPKPHKSDLHPTMKPVSLVVNAIQNSTSRDSIVVDLFLGSGTTLIASEKTNRICYGIEFSPTYVAVIIKRWEQFTGKKAERIVNGQGT